MTLKERLLVGHIPDPDFTRVTGDQQGHSRLVSTDSHIAGRVLLTASSRSSPSVAAEGEGANSPSPFFGWSNFRDCCTRSRCLELCDPFETTGLRSAPLSYHNDLLIAYLEAPVIGIAVVLIDLEMCHEPTTSPSEFGR